MAAIVSAVKTTQVEGLLRVLRRDLSAEDARIFAPDEALPPPSENDLRAPLSGGRVLVVTFADRPPDMDERRRRVELWVESFHAMLEGAGEVAPIQRPPPERSLHEELRALAERAGAQDAIVIDARSPVVWGAALASQEGDEKAGAPRPIQLLREVPAPGGEGDRLRLVKSPRKAASSRATPPTLSIVRGGGGGVECEAQGSASDKALRVVRALPELPTLHRGGQLHHMVTDPELGLIARSFAAIYVLLLVFPGPFDELRAKRALLQALPIIERLVLALPPRDPAPQMGGVVALRPGRSPRRRR